MSIVFFGYSQFGHDALRWLVEHKYPVYAVVSHEHDPKEHVWFQTMEPIAKDRGIPFITGTNFNDIYRRIEKIAPDLILSVYYRHMIPMKILNLARKGAYNIHGSLLPKYRGKAPINWAILNGESETGLSLHEMIEEPDAGALIDQKKIDIIPQDKAGDVLEKMRPLIGQLLEDNLPALLDGTAIKKPMDLTQGAYFSGRKPEDGRINEAEMTAIQVHNLIRALQPYPQFPGAYLEKEGYKRILHRSMVDTPEGLTLEEDKKFDHFYSDGCFEWLKCKDDTWLKIIA